MVKCITSFSLASCFHRVLGVTDRLKAMFICQGILLRSTTLLFGVLLARDFVMFLVTDFHWKRKQRRKEKEKEKVNNNETKDSIWFSEVYRFERCIIVVAPLCPPFSRIRGYVSDKDFRQILFLLGRKIKKKKKKKNQS